MTMEQRAEGGDAPAPPPPPSHQYPSGPETHPGQAPIESGPTSSKKPKKKKTEKRLKISIAILGFLSALLALVTGILAAVAHDTSQKNETLTVNLNDANGEKASAAASLSAAESTISSLQSQLATATAAPPTGPSGSIASTAITPRRKADDLVLVRGASLVDLDSMSDPQWRGEGPDIGWSTSAFPYNGSAWIVPMGQKADYNTCYNSTKWDTPQLSLQSIEPGQYFCFKTTEKRYAAVQVLKMTPIQADIAVVVYDPPDTQ